MQPYNKLVVTNKIIQLYNLSDAAFLRSSLEASNMLIQYKNNNGAATKNWLVQSGEGVMMAATISITTKANLKYFFIRVPVSNPIFASTRQNIGSSKASPQPRIRLVSVPT